jgi:hypothetical protein
MSLQNMILNRDAQLLHHCERRRLQRHLHKLTKAAQIFLAKNALQRDQIRFLLKTNNEAKVRRSTKSIVLGKARVMSYADLKAARADRINKAAVKETRKTAKRSRKRKRNEPEADSPQPSVKTMEIAEALEPVKCSENMGMTRATECVSEP